MQTTTLIAILPQPVTLQPPPGLRWFAVDDVTAVLQATPPRRDLRANDRKAYLVRAATYQRHLETLRPYGTVLPVRQGSDMQMGEIPGLVRASRDILQQLETSLKELDQFQVTIGWDAAGVLSRFKDAPELTTLFASTRVSTRDLARAVMALSERLRTEFHTRLAHVSQDTIALPCDPDMLLNLVLLCPTQGHDALDAAVAAIDATWTEGLQIRQIGPAAPVSFATLIPRWITPAMVTTTFATLGLSPDASLSAVAGCRRGLLQTRPQDKAAIDAAIRIAVAARSTDPSAGFYLCDICRDGTASIPITALAAA